MRHHPFTLSFAGAQRDLEASFRSDYFSRNLSTIRWSLLAGLCAYLGFGGLDRLVFPQDYRVLWSIRFGVVCPCILFALAASWLRGFGRVWQPVLAAAVALAGTMIVAMTVVAPPPHNETYYAGVTLVLVSGSCGLRRSVGSLCSRMRRRRSGGAQRPTGAALQ